MFTEKLDDDSIIRFQCACCGSCCRSGLDIFLNPLDVWNIRNAMKKPTQFLKRNYFRFETMLEYGVYPFCLIKMRKNGYCPFAEDNLCSIHHFRPAACRFYPVVHYFDGKRESSFAVSPDVPGCPGLKAEKKYSLQGWLIVNKFLMYEGIIEMTPEIAEALGKPFDEEISAPLFDIMFNFDEVDDFPFRDSFPMEGSSDDKFAAWLRRKVRAYIRSLSGG